MKLKTHKYLRRNKIKKHIEEIINKGLKYYESFVNENNLKKFNDMEKENFNKKYLELFKDLTLSDDNYIIRPFSNFKEVQKEGIVCGNAIFQYFETYLCLNHPMYFFIMREKKSPDTPYISMLFDKDGNIQEKPMKELVLPNNM